MTSITTFSPKWLAPPGATVLDLLHERKIPLPEFAAEARIDLQRLSRLICGVEALTPDWAESLSKVLGAPPAFWLKREELYRADLRRLSDMLSPGHEQQGWLNDLPLKDMVRYGWIDQGADAHETALNACAFFGVTNQDAFERTYRNLLSSSAYLQTAAFEIRPTALAAWLRQGEIAATAVTCSAWNSSKLHSALPSLRALTRERNPSLFLPKLESLLADCGVVLAIVRAPKGCRASGATRFLNPHRALVQMSFRYLADDQFWFTLFHEIGHLLLHTHAELFLEELENRNADAENEADEFAIKALFANVGTAALQNVETSRFAIARLARRAGIAPGIVVGQLQAQGRIPYNHFNYLKTRYAWSDSSSTL